MGSEGETESRKAHYNISMSRRTRKAESLNVVQKKMFEERESELMMRKENQKSLKQFMEGRCSLAQHFKEEEKQQSVVVRPPDQDGDERLRLKRSMMRNYAQVLSHLIKVKQESYIRSWRKSAVSLKLIKHK